MASLRLPSSCTSSYMSRLCKATMISLRCSILMTGRSGCLLVLSLASLWRSFSSAFPYLHACPNTGQLTEGDRAGGHHEWRWASTGTRCRSVSKCCNAATSNGRPLDPPHARARARTPQRIEIRHPEDGTIITNYTGGGRGMRVILRYEISNAAPGGMSSIAISKDGVPVPCINCQPKQTPSTVEVPFWLTPADYALTVIAHDAAGREVAQSRTRFQVELPAFARQVRVLGTSMLWAAMQAGFGPLKCLHAWVYVYTCIHIQVRVFGTYDTLLAVMEALERKVPGAYLRFGDGDVSVANGGDDQLQAQQHALQRELQAAMAMQGAHVIKGLSLQSQLFGGVEEGMADGNHLLTDSLALGLLEMANKFWRPTPIVDVYSNNALAHAACTYPELAVQFLVELRRTRPVALVGNENVPRLIVDALFGRQVAHVKTPPVNAYGSIDRVHSELLTLIALSGVEEGRSGAESMGSGTLRVVVMVAGSTGAALQQRLGGREDVFTFDFGSLLDALSGFSTRAGLEGDRGFAKVAEGVVHGSVPPGWIVAAGFDEARRKALLESFCASIHDWDDPCPTALLAALRAERPVKTAALADLLATDVAGGTDQGPQPPHEL